MSNKFLLKKSSVASKVPLTTDLDYGELALNYADGKIYFKNASNVIKSFTLDDAVVTLTGTQTLTNKTLTSPTISGGTINNAVIGGSTPAAITGSTVTSTGNLVSSYSSGDEGGEILLTKPQTNSTIGGAGVRIDVYQNKLRIWEDGGTNRGVFIDLTSAAAGVASNLLSGGSVAVLDIAGDTGTDSVTLGINTLTFVGGTGVTSAVTDNTITFDIDSTVATLTGTQTLTNKRINTRAVSAGSTSGNLTPNGDTTDVFNAFGLTGAITLLAPSGTPVDGQRIILRLEDDGTGRGITWTTTSGAYRAVGSTLPTTTVAGKITYVGCVYNSTDIFWDVVAVATQA